MLDIIQLFVSEGLWIFPVVLALLSALVIVTYRLITKAMPQKAPADESEFYELLDKAGYEYDPSRDIFVTKMDCWQKKYGYCRLYDEACPSLCLIVDSEPVEFEYDGKYWLIEFWKGQYYLNTGFEIGVYNTDKPELDIPELFTGNFYDAVDKEDMLEIQFILYKNGKELFFREEKHWWLTGFKTGLFSEPSELTARIRITFKDEVMCHNFIKAMKKLGYQDHAILTNGIVAEFMFDKPRSKQPLSRTPETDWMVQRYNEHCCKVFQEATEGCATWPEKLAAIREKEPHLYNAVIEVGKGAEVFKVFEKLKKHLWRRRRKKAQPETADQAKPDKVKPVKTKPDKAKTRKVKPDEKKPDKEKKAITGEASKEQAITDKEINVTQTIAEKLDQWEKNQSDIQ